MSQRDVSAPYRMNGNLFLMGEFWLKQSLEYRGAARKAPFLVEGNPPCLRQRPLAPFWRSEAMSGL